MDIVKPTAEQVEEATRVLLNDYLADVRKCAEQFARDIQRGVFRSQDHLEWALEQELLAQDRVREPLGARATLYLSMHLQRLDWEIDLRLGWYALVALHADVRVELERMLGKKAGEPLV
jgi:hypothetical protein